MFITPLKVLSHLDRLHGWQAGGMPPAPVTVEWDLSNRCYLGCRYGGAASCHFAHTHTRGPWTLHPAHERVDTGDLADIDAVGRICRELKAAGVQGVVWSGGGEPTVHPHWKTAVLHAADAGLHQGMYTAGGLIDDDGAGLLKAALDWIVISLDYLTAEDYQRAKGVDGFESVLFGLRLLTQAPGPAVIGLSFLLHEENYRSVFRMVQFAQEQGATYVTFRPAIAWDAARPSVCTTDRSWVTEAEPLLRQAATYPHVELDVSRFLSYRDWHGRGYDTCYGIRFSTVITPDARVWVCPQHRGHPDACLGDLTTESFTSLWARHPGQWTDLSSCRVMCRLHQTNDVLAGVYAPVQHRAFV